MTYQLRERGRPIMVAPPALSCHGFPVLVMDSQRHKRSRPARPVADGCTPSWWQVHPWPGSLGQHRVPHSPWNLRVRYTEGADVLGRTVPAFQSMYDRLGGDFFRAHPGEESERKIRGATRGSQCRVKWVNTASRSYFSGSASSAGVCRPFVDQPDQV